MNTAQEHAIEQANLIAQLVKYADRLIVVESAAPPERHDFIEQVTERLPDSVEVLALAADARSSPNEIITLVSQVLQLSPGIESPRQLASAVHEALSTQGRMLVIIENVNEWIGTDVWPDMLSNLRAAHELAPNHLLFMLTGDIDLTEQLRAEPELAGMQGDIHQCLLLDAAFAAASAPQGSTAATSSRNGTKEEALVADLNQTTSPLAAAAKARRPFNPTLLVMAGISVAVVSFGGFALLTRTTNHEPASKKLALEPSTQMAQATQGSGAHPLEAPSSGHDAATAVPTPPPQTNNPMPNDGETAKASDTNQTPPPSEPPVRHLQPVPTPAGAEQSAPPSAAEKGPLPAIQTAAAPATQADTQPPANLVKPTPPPVHSKPTQTAGKRAPTPRPHKATQAPLSGTDHAWYHAQPKSHATLQLGAFTDAKAAHHFIRQHESSSKVKGWHIFAQRPKNQTLYTVTVGNFSSLNEARKSIALLPEPLRQIKPYPRSFNAIDQVISK